MSCLIIDTDPGVDDMLAILGALGEPALQVAAVTTVGGNVSLERVTSNALKILTLAGRADIAVHAGAAGPLERGPRDASYVHGEDGLGGVALPEPVAVARTEAAAARLARMESGTLACLGPLTNVALALRAQPALARRVPRVAVMGGGFGTWTAETPKGPLSSAGNVTPHAEFNFWADPVAAAEVFSSPLPIDLVPLDVTHRTLAGPEWLARLRAAGAVGRAVAPALESYSAWFRGKWGLDAGPLHDPNVIAAVAHPEWYQWRRGRVSVDTSDEQRGRTAFTPDESGPHRVAFGVEVEAFLGWLLASIARSGEAR
jgi:purine nucleosidase